MEIFTKKGITSVGDKNKNTLSFKKCKTSFFSGIISGLLFPIIVGIIIELYREGKMSELLGYLIGLFK